MSDVAAVLKAERKRIRDELTSQKAVKKKLQGELTVTQARIDGLQGELDNLLADIALLPVRLQPGAEE